MKVQSCSYCSHSASLTRLALHFMTSGHSDKAKDLYTPTPHKLSGTLQRLPSHPSVQGCTVYYCIHTPAWAVFHSSTDATSALLINQLFISLLNKSFSLYILLATRGKQSLCYQSALSRTPSSCRKCIAACQVPWC